MATTVPTPTVDVTKGKWKERTDGKIPVKVTYTVKSKNRAPYEVTRTHWVLPDKAFTGEHELHFEKIAEEKIELLAPDNPRRQHSHYGAEELHPVNLYHRDVEIQSEHRDEKEIYGRNYFKLLQEKDAWARKKQLERRKLLQETARIERKRSPKPTEIDKLVELKKKILQAQKALERRSKVEKIPWMDKYDVIVEPDREIKFRGIPTLAFAYTLPKSDYRIYLFNDPISNYYIWSKKLGLEKFDAHNKAYSRLEEIFEHSRLKNRIFGRSLAIQRKSIIKKAQNLISIATEYQPPIEIEHLPETQEDMALFSEFKSGDDFVTLEGDNDQFKVTQNGVIDTVTDSLQEALSKYYSSVSKIIEAQTQDKDMGLELFGEHCLNTARQTRQMMASLGNANKSLILNSLDFSALEFPYNENWISKYEPQSSVFGIVPVQEEMGMGASEGGWKPSRGDLTDEDYEEEELEEEKQEYIKQPKSKGAGIAPIGAALVSKEVQYQQVPPRDEESKVIEEIDKPVRVNRTYSQTLSVPENKVIERI